MLRIIRSRFEKSYISKCKAMRILLATDGSKYSDLATAQCGRIVSELENAVVKIITVSDFIVEFDSEEFVSETEFIDLLEQEVYKRTSKILRRAEDIIRHKSKDVQIEKRMFVGSAKELIVKEAKRWNADLIIVGSHGYGFWTRAFLGSVSDAVVHHAPCSVLVVRKS